MIDSSEVATAYLDDNGKPLSVAGTVGSGVMRFNATIETDAGMKIVERSILALWSLAGGVHHGQLLTFDGVTYRVDEDPFPSADRVFCRIPVTGPIAAAIATARSLTSELGDFLLTESGDRLTTEPMI